MIVAGGVALVSLPYAELHSHLLTLPSSCKQLDFPFDD